MKFIKRMIILGVAAVLLVWLLAIAKCEIYTAIYGHEFKNSAIDGIPLGKNLKVIKYSADYASIYYLEDCSRLVSFRKKAGGWEVNTLKVVRYAEDKGSRLVVWPYLWHYVLTG